MEWEGGGIMMGPHPPGCRFLGQAAWAMPMTNGNAVVRACCVPGTVLDAWGTAMSKAVKTSVLVG